MTQVQFSQEVGLSLSLITQFEAGRIPSQASLEKLKTYAVNRDRADLAALFDPAPFRVRKVFIPPKKAGAAVDPHGLLDEILQSGDDQAKLAVENFLFITTQYLRGVK